MRNIRTYTVKLEGWLTVSVNMGDITKENVEAITNAANSYLRVKLFFLNFLA